MLKKILTISFIPVLVTGCGQVKNITTGSNPVAEKIITVKSIPVKKTPAKAGYNAKGERWFKAINIPGLDDE